MTIPFNDLLPFTGDPFFALEPGAEKYVDDAIPSGNLEELLRVAKRPLQIDELRGLEAVYDTFPILVVRAPDIQEAGICYMADEYDILESYGVSALLALNPDRFEGSNTVRDLFIHELTHVVTGELHGWDFLCALNAFRCHCGLNPSFDPYDIRDGFEDMLPDDLANDVELAQRWCARVGMELSRLPNLRESLFGAILQCRAALENWAPDLATPAAFMALADEVCKEVRH